MEVLRFLWRCELRATNWMKTDCKTERNSSPDLHQLTQVLICLIPAWNMQKWMQVSDGTCSCKKVMWDLLLGHNIKLLIPLFHREKKVFWFLCHCVLLCNTNHFVNQRNSIPNWTPKSDPTKMAHDSSSHLYRAPRLSLNANIRLILLPIILCAAQH